ncbi:VOC family protein [Ornithinimicrobium sp. Y1847]|uniref:VOC family protein n=1 Tax=Ornithinimicrobium sp. Y1847 TaxID=3405419 RepID=UPI003B66FE89
MDLARSAGATVLVEPGEAGSAGIAGALVDPSGASVALWQPGDIASFDVTGRPGTPVWFELMTLDFEASDGFYSKVFDFDLHQMPGEGMRYATNSAQQSATSGICEANEWVPEDVGSYWRVYLAVEDCDASAAQIQELGGSLLDGPMDSPFGRLATVADPNGATFQIIQPPARG